MTSMVQCRDAPLSSFMACISRERLLSSRGVESAVTGVVWLLCEGSESPLGFAFACLRNCFRIELMAAGQPGIGVRSASFCPLINELPASESR